MWIAVPEGFFSVVVAREGNGEGPPDPGMVQVRARLRSHLEALQTRFPKLIGSTPILETARSDYRFRCILTTKTWCSVLMALGESCSQYSNVKGEVARQATGEDGRRYVEAMHETWAIFHGLQERPGKGRSSRH